MRDISRYLIVLLRTPRAPLRSARSGEDPAAAQQAPLMRKRRSAPPAHDAESSAALGNVWQEPWRMVKPSSSPNRGTPHLNRPVSISPRRSTRLDVGPRRARLRGRALHPRSRSRPAADAEAARARDRNSTCGPSPASSGWTKLHRRGRPAKRIDIVVWRVARRGPRQVPAPQVFSPSDPRFAPFHGEHRVGRRLRALSRAPEDMPIWIARAEGPRSDRGARTRN